MVWGSVRLCGIAGSVFCGRARLRALPRTSGSLPGLCHERPAVSRMDADDEFGDLYADIGGEAGRSAAAEAPLVGEGGGDLYDEDDEELLYGKSSSLPPPPSLVLPSKSTPAAPENGGARQSAIQLPLPAVKEVDNDELFLYGQLYGDSSDKPVDEKEEEEEVAASLPRPEKWPDPRDDDSSAAELAGGKSSFDLLPGIRASGLGKPAEIPLGALGMVAPGSGEREANVDGVVGPGRTIVGLGSRGLASNGESLSSRIGVQVGEVARHANSPPGLAVGRTVGGELLPEDEEEGQELVDDWEGGEGEREQGGEEEEGEEEEEEDEGPGGGVEGEGEEEENWESDSEDDLQIVLNEEGPTYAGERPADGEVGEGSEDEDEDLVIVTGDDDAVPVEEQEWEEQALPLDALPGTTLSSASDRAPGSEDRGQSGGPGMSSGVPRIGYSGQGYHAHHMQYKYVRPGAGGASGSAPQSGQGSPQAGVSRSGGAWGSGRGLGGRGDWSGDGGRGSSGHRSQGGMMGWGSGRGFPSGLEFSLPPTKTVFDVDLDSLEEKPWRRPGVDVTDYFNFNFSESSWKQYCRQLAQLRLEATMQSKIRVYESGRSEQDFDPDLPPELAAATGMHEAYSEPGGPLQRHQDNAGPGRGRGFGRGRMMPPAGRAIQVEGGGGERRPSADVRRQRSRDSDAIVLHDASEDDPPTPAAGNEGSEEYQEDEERAAAPGKERRFYRNAPSGPWDMDGPPSTWERENMPMGVGMMGLHGGGMMAGHRIDGEGPPGPFPIVPAMPMHQPGPNFGMFPGTGFRPPPVGRAGIVRPPLYNGPRPGLPLPILGPPPENFPAVMLPHDYHEPSRRRTPPHLTPPRRTPPRRTPPRRTSPRRTTPSVGHPADWDDELSNGSGANWNVREGRSQRETRERDGGSGNQHTDEVEGREGSHLERRGRDNDRVSLRERSVDEGSVDGRSEERKRSSSREHRVEENDWDDGPSLRVLKKPKLQSQVDVRVKSEREDFSQPKALKSSVRREDPNHNWEPSRDRVLLEEDISQERRHDSLHKASDRKGPPHREESHSSQRKETGWIDRADEELKDRRQLREREEVQRRKARDDDVRHRRNRDEMERERRRDDIERERRHLRKEKEEERFPQDDRLKRNMESLRVSREREDSRARDVKSLSMERETEHGREKRKREEDRIKLKSRLDDFREPEGRLKGRVEDLRESDGRGKARLNERRENDGRHKGRFEGLRENDGRVKGRLDEFRDVDGRGKIKVEDGREGEARLKGRIDDARENDGRGKGWLEDGRNSDGRGKVRHDDVRESAGRTRGQLEDARGQLEDARENVVRGRSRLEDPRETDGRGKSLLSGKGRQEDLRDTDGKMYSRIENLSESHGRMPAWGDHVKENDSAMKRRHEDTREITGKSRSRQEDGREGEERSEVWAADVREAEGRAKRRAEDSKDFDRLVDLPDDGRQRTARTRGHVEDHRDTELKGKLHPDEGRISDGRSRRYEKEDDTHSWEDRRKHEEQSSRGGGSHATWSQSSDKRKVVDELWQQKEKRGWERNATNKESLNERNGALSGFAEDKSYRSRMDGSKNRRVEEYRANDQFDKASTRDPVELASSNARHKEKKMVIPKRIDDSFERRKRGKDASSRQNRVGRDDDNSLPPDNGSSEEEAERKGRSKLERWTSKKERDAAANASGEALLKWDIPDSGREKPSSTSQHGLSKRKQQSRGKPHWKEEKERRRVTASSGKGEFYPEEKERDTILDAPASVPKDAAETRKERLERLKLQREEEAARRQKNETSILHTGSVEEVKQERPARKRRWGNG